MSGYYGRWSGLANQLDTTGARMVTIRVLLFATFAAPLLSQTKFADSKNNNKNVDEKIFTGDPTIDTLGGGLIGVGLGALGASILGPTIGQVHTMKDVLQPIREVVKNGYFTVRLTIRWGDIRFFDDFPKENEGNVPLLPDNLV